MVALGQVSMMDSSIRNKSLYIAVSLSRNLFFLTDCYHVVVSIACSFSNAAGSLINHTYLKGTLWSLILRIF